MSAVILLMRRKCQDQRRASHGNATETKQHTGVDIIPCLFAWISFTCCREKVDAMDFHVGAARGKELYGEVFECVADPR